MKSLSLSLSLSVSLSLSLSLRVCLSVCLSLSLSLSLSFSFSLSSLTDRGRGGAGRFRHPKHGGAPSHLRCVYGSAGPRTQIAFREVEIECLKVYDMISGPDRWQGVWCLKVLSV